MANTNTGFKISAVLEDLIIGISHAIFRKHSKCPTQSIVLRTSHQITHGRIVISCRNSTTKLIRVTIEVATTKIRVIPTPAGRVPAHLVVL